MRQLNIAEQIRSYLGMPTPTTFKHAHGEKTAQHCKRGPGRYHQQGKKKDEDGNV